MVAAFQLLVRLLAALVVVSFSAPSEAFSALLSKTWPQSSGLPFQGRRHQGLPQPRRLNVGHKTPVLLQSSSIVDDDSDLNRWTPLTLQEKLRLPIQLVLSIYFLLLLPSGLAINKLCGACVLSTIPYEYIAFFGSLVVPRSFRFGKFAKANTDKSTKKRSTSIQSLLLFILSLVGSHWFATYQFARKNVNSNASFFAPRTCLALRLLALTLVGCSGWELGKSYDRVAQPDELITTGPYRVVRHPIYTAYLLLFSSTLLTLRAPVACGLMLGAAMYFYWGRMQSEEGLLEECFGDDYVEYKARAKWRLFPFLL
ncbi:isoprenylcysteine carboxyl methyltransferase [Seminavis robusta]|uniref:Isoprenylcysteine carboxyl methyltransferase n=1 Tax=Seminavis robusta TaxID=568900 RepID=A0A9N8DQH7_9STRA|nr:isoprenylcysteine carboxyl methyltransferase [Seminavis robusta]|eukprot:Sro282_g107530.1 isoprenylcysteine carboxyl methyltransferase (313) ;mRNA; r:53900-54838